MARVGIRAAVLSTTATVIKQTLGCLGCLLLLWGCHTEGDRETYSQELLQTLSREYPNDPSYPFQLGRLYLRDGRFDEARLQFEKSLRIDRNFHNARAGLGLVALEKHQLNRAKLLFDQVLKDDPGNRMAIRGLQRLSFEHHQSS